MPPVDIEVTIRTALESVQRDLCALLPQASQRAAAMGAGGQNTALDLVEKLLESLAKANELRKAVSSAPRP